MKKHLIQNGLGLLLAVVLSLWMAGAQAGLLAIDTVNGNVGNTAASFTRGNAFSLSDAFLIDGLGYFDIGGDGLAESHDVGIFTAGGALVLGPVAVTAASPLVGSGSALGDWRVESILPFLLAPGDYVIAGFDPTGADDLPISDTYTDIAQVVRSPGFVFSGGAGLTFPTTPVGFNASIATFTGSVAVPEPTILALFGMGLAGLGFSRRKKG